MQTLIFAVLGGIFGASIGDSGGFGFGVALGILLSLVVQARKQIGELKNEASKLATELSSGQFQLNARIDTLQHMLRHTEHAIAETQAHLQAQAQAPVAATPIVTAPIAATPIEQALEVATPALGAPALEVATPALEIATPAPVAPAPEMSVFAAAKQAAQPRYEQPSQPQSPPDQHTDAQDIAAMRSQADIFDQGVELVRSFFFGGNTVVRVGILVLLVGVALLLRWAAEHDKFPIEARMGCAALIAIALIVVGFRQRVAQPGFGRTLQGGGVAALYLVVFFSYRSYELVPSGLAFALLASIALFSGVLAVVQDALALIVIGQVGGFMAPVLASSGSGNHVGLFSYYLVLNLLTLAIAWVKPWRALNVIGFVFTFGVGSTWGALKYEPEHFASTEPFLIAFFLLYSAIPVLHALRQPEARRGWVDASLVFGTPLAVLVLQYAMVHEMPFAMAYSTLGLAAFYVGLGSYLYKRQREALRTMIEAFLAIGIGFATIAIPYGLDNHNLTGATWALEGAGLYWMGVRQQRILSRLAGSALQIFALIALGMSFDTWEESSLPIINTLFFGGLFSALGMGFIATYAQQKRSALPDGEPAIAQFFLTMALVVLLSVTVRELDLHVAKELRAGALLAWIGALAIGVELFGKRLDWLYPRWHGLLVFPALGLALAVWYGDFDQQPLARLGWLGFPIAFAAAGFILRKLVQEVAALRFLHTLLAWELGVFVVTEAMQLASDVAHLSSDWTISIGCAVIAAMLYLLQARVRSAPSESWPLGEHATYYRAACAGFAAVLLLLSLVMNAELSGKLAPLPYIPIVSPIDLALIAALLAILAFRRSLVAHPDLGELKDLVAALPTVLAAFAFIDLNGVLVRSVHAYADVPFEAQALWRSVALQVALSISWTLLGLFATVFASKRGRRPIWFIGASLLGIVVLKLFTLDLVRLETIAKIGTFLVVGFLLVLVGYFAPVPPSASKETAS